MSLPVGKKWRVIYAFLYFTTIYGVTLMFSALQSMPKYKMQSLPLEKPKDSLVKNNKYVGSD